MFCSWFRRFLFLHRCLDLCAWGFLFLVSLTGTFYRRLKFRGFLFGTSFLEIPLPGSWYWHFSPEVSWFGFHFWHFFLKISFPECLTVALSLKIPVSSFLFGILSLFGSFSMTSPFPGFLVWYLVPEDSFSGGQRFLICPEKSRSKFPFQWLCSGRFLFQEP